MPWRCQLLDHKPSVSTEARIGDMWYVALVDYRGEDRTRMERELSDDWRAQRAHTGRILYVMTPAGPWCVDKRSFDGQQWGRGWAITGEAPNTTASPSINFAGEMGYHGWLRDGWLSDDLEGRAYP